MCVCLPFLCIRAHKSLYTELWTSFVWSKITWNPYYVSNGLLVPYRLTSLFYRQLLYLKHTDMLLGLKKSWGLSPGSIFHRLIVWSIPSPTGVWKQWVLAPLWHVTMVMAVVRPAMFRRQPVWMVVGGGGVLCGDRSIPLSIWLLCVMAIHGRSSESMLVLRGQWHVAGHWVV